MKINMHKWYVIKAWSLLVFIGFCSFGQDLKQMELGSSGLSVIGFDQDLQINETLPLVSFLIDGKSVNTKDYEVKNGVITIQSGIQVRWEANHDFDKGIKEKVVKLIPYYAWDNRGDTSMMVWFPTKSEMIQNEIP